jgi:hypothetical protein
MSDMAPYLGDMLLDWLKGAAFDAAPADIYASLYNGDPDAAGVELTGTINLTRQAITFGSIAARSMDNSAEIDFGTANATGTATYVVLWDAAVSGNQISKKSIASAGITSGEKVAISVGDLTLTY